MDGRDQIKRHIWQIQALREDIDVTRDIVANYANNVYESIHADERRIDAREAVRRVDFARELLALATSTLEQAVGDWEYQIPLLRHDDA
jgi:hypothetical protein